MWTDERGKRPVLRHPEGATRQGWDPADPFDPTDPHFWIRLEHLARYQFAVDFLSQYGPNGVADVACGTGYGLLELQAAADSVVGVGNDPGMLRRYRERLGRRAAHLQQIDLNRERLTAASGQEALTPS
jgi:SAM-dependent methyltransferase